MHRRYTVFALPFLLLLTLISLVGCGSTEPVRSSYNGVTGRTNFQTKALETGMQLQGSGYSNGPRIQYKVGGSCKGRACTPEAMALTFMLSDSSSPVFFYGRTVVIDAGLERFTWKPLSERKVSESASVVSVIVRVEMTLEQLEAFANRKRVRGRLGDRPFSLSYEERAPLRQLLVRMSGAGDVVS